jgi:hypothetical protein
MEKSKKEIATSRNWLKARLLGFPLPHYGTHLTESEQVAFNEIMALRNHLINNWDENSKALGMTVRPKKEIWKD